MRRNEADITLSRREFLTYFGITAAASATAGAAVALAFFPRKTEPQAAGQNGAPTPEPITPEKLLTKILTLPANTEERNSKEQEYLGLITENATLSDVTKGLWVTAEPLVRGSLIDKRYDLRKKKVKTLGEIPQDKANWTRTIVHPEVLGTCLDVYPIAKKIIGELNKTGMLRNDVSSDIDPDELMINPGGMAKLIETETGGVLFNGTRYGFSFIGSGLAMENINDSPNAFPNAKPALKELCKRIFNMTGLLFVPENIPGSVRGSGDLSGGAISIQFMPDRALNEDDLIKSVLGRSLNIFDPTDATLMAWVYLAHDLSDPGSAKNLSDPRWRPGYLKGDESRIYGALRKWNPKQAQMDDIYYVAKNYYDWFIGSGKYPY